MIVKQIGQTIRISESLLSLQLALDPAEVSFGYTEMTPFRQLSRWRRRKDRSVFTPARRGPIYKANFPGCFLRDGIAFALTR